MDNKIQVKIKKIHPDAVLPKYAHNGDVGMDLTAISVEYDVKNDMYIYHTGLAFESDFNYGQFLFPRSSNRKTDAYLCNHVGIADSAIYRGEILFCFKNRESIEAFINNKCNNAFDSKVKQGFELPKINPNKSLSVLNAIVQAIEERQKIKEELYSNIESIGMSRAPYNVGDRIGQMVFFHYPTVELIEVTELSETDRGEGGFGSTGN